MIKFADHSRCTCQIVQITKEEQQQLKIKYTKRRNEMRFFVCCFFYDVVIVFLHENFNQTFESLPID